MSEQSERELAQAISGLQAAVGDLREAVGGLQEATRANTAAIGRLTDRVGSLEGTMERVHVSLASKIDAGEMVGFVAKTNERLERLEEGATGD